MTDHDWDVRYRDQPGLWGRGPNAAVAEQLGDLPPGRALDLGAGDGRHSLWLAGLGHDVVAVDGSQVAVSQLRSAAAAADLQVDAQVGDLTEATAWPQGSFDVVLLAYLHLPRAALAEVHRRAAELVAPGGVWLLVGHDRTNLTDGVGGPPDPDVLTDPDEVVADLAGAGLTVITARRIDRPVSTDDGPKVAIDTLVRAHR